MCKTIYLTVTNDTIADQRMDRICSTLSHHGYNVHLIGRDLGRQSTKVRPYKVHLINLFFNKGPLFYLEYNIRLFIFLIANKWDAVCSVDIDTIVSGRLATFIKRKKLIFDSHEYYIKTPELKGRNFTKSMWTVVEKIFVRKINLAYTVNEELASILTNRYNINFQVIKNFPISKGLEKKNTKDLKKDPFILVYQGAINKGRGVEIYIEAMDSLPECELWIIGSGDLSYSIQDKCSQSSSSSRIKLLGQVSFSDLPSITRKADLGLNMLDSDSESYYYSLANKYFDYIEAGIPGIHMNFPSYSFHENQFETSVLVDEYTEDALVHAVTVLRSQPKMYNELVDKCAIAREEYTWEKESKRLMVLYDGLFK